MNYSFIKTALLAALIIVPRTSACFLDEYFDEQNNLKITRDVLREKALGNHGKLQVFINKNYPNYSRDSFGFKCPKYKTFDELKQNLLNYFINGNKQSYLLENHLYILTTIIINSTEAPELATSMITADYSSRYGLIITKALCDTQKSDDPFKQVAMPMLNYYNNMFSGGSEVVNLDDNLGGDDLKKALNNLKLVLERFSETEPSIPAKNPLEKVSIIGVDLTGLKELFDDPRTKTKLTEGLLEGIIKTPAVVNLLKSNDDEDQAERAKELSNLLYGILVRNPRLKNILTADSEESSDQALKDFSTSIYDALIKNAHLKSIFTAETVNDSNNAAEEVRAGIELAINKTLESALRTATEGLIERIIKTPAILNLLRSNEANQEQKAKDLSDLLHGILIRNARLKNILTAENEGLSDQALKEFATALYNAFVQNDHLKNILTAGTTEDSEQALKALATVVTSTLQDSLKSTTQELNKSAEEILNNVEKNVQDKYTEIKKTAYNTSFLGKIKPLQETDNPSAVKALCPQIIQWSFIISACGYIGYKSAELARKGIAAAGKKSIAFAKQKYSDWKNKKQEEKPQEEPEKQPEPEAETPSLEIETPIENTEILNPELAK